MKCSRCQFENPSDTSYCGKCGLPLSAQGQRYIGMTETMIPLLMQLERGILFAGRYEVVEEIGRGGMGRVYKVFDRKIKEFIALKLLRPEISTDERTVERFSNEVKLARKISHRNVCRIYDLGEDGTTVYITMEYVSGEDLKSFIRRSGHLTESKAVVIAKQICEGLVEAHHLGVLHRDLKPQNIMIDREGNARIMDFGIARSLYAPGITGSGMMIGTPEYMSPEQAEAGDVDHRSDIYSLGVLLYEMVTGRVPFAGETPLSVALKQKTGTPEDPGNFNPLISNDLRRLILKCLEKSAEQRYQSAKELLSDLNEIEKRLPTAERPAAGKKHGVSKDVAVRFSLKKLIVPALIFVVIVFIWMVFQIRSPKKEKDSPSPKAFRTQSDRGGAPSDSKTSSSQPRLPLKEMGKLLDSVTLEDSEKMLEAIRAKIPEVGPYLGAWNEIKEKINQAKRQHDQGNVEGSKRSYDEGQSRMSSLMALVAEKERADAYRLQMEKAKKDAGNAQTDKQKNLLYRLAVDKEKDAAGAYQKNDFAGAKTLYKLLHVCYVMSVSGANDQEQLLGLQGFVEKLAVGMPAGKVSEQAAWFFTEASKEKQNADTLHKSGQSRPAAEAYLQAAFLYEKAIEKLQEENAR